MTLVRTRTREAAESELAAAHYVRHCCCIRTTPCVGLPDVYPIEFNWYLSPRWCIYNVEYRILAFNAHTIGQPEANVAPICRRGELVCATVVCKLVCATACTRHARKCGPSSRLHGRFCTPEPRNKRFGRCRCEQKAHVYICAASPINANVNVDQSAAGVSLHGAQLRRR